MKPLSLAAVIGCAVAGAACGDGSPAPTSPSPPGRDQIRFDGVFYAPHQVLELQPGARIELHVVADPGYPSTGPTPPQWTSFEVQTDAPAGLVSLSHEIRSRDVEVIGPMDEMLTGQVYFGVVRIEVGERPDGAGVGQTYELRLVASGEGFAETPLRFRVAARETPTPCDALVLTAEAEGRSGPAGRFFSRVFPDATDYRSGRITLRSPRFGVGMRWLAPYRFRGGELKDAPWDPSAQRKQDVTGHPFLFLAGAELISDGEGFEQTFDLAWFDELELLASAPGCEPRRLRCDTRGGCSPD